MLDLQLKKNLLLLPCSLIWLSFSFFTVQSATVQKFSLEELAQRSQKIVVGRCLSTESRWNEKNTLILTFSHFAVSEDLKGQSNGSVTVMTVGGSLNGITQTVSGSPQFSVGEEAVLFLEPTKLNHWQPVGLSQGKFLIVKNSRSGEKEVVNNLTGLELYDTSARTLSVQQRSNRMPLESFLARVRILSRAQK